MEVRLTLQELTEIGSHGFPRVSRRGHRGGQAGNGRKWQAMAENRSQVKKDDICQKWQEMDFRVFPVNPLLLRTIESDDISTIILCD